MVPTVKMQSTSWCEPLQVDQQSFRRRQSCELESSFSLVGYFCCVMTFMVLNERDLFSKTFSVSKLFAPTKTTVSEMQVSSCLGLVGSCIVS